MRAGTHKVSNTILSGATPQVKETSNIELIDGRMWTDSEEEKSSNVVVLGIGGLLATRRRR